MPAILFLAAPDLEDTLWATGAVEAALSRGDAGDLVVACPVAQASLFRAHPRLKRQIPCGPRLTFADTLSLWRRVQKPAPDIVIDARGGALGGLLGSPVRLRPEKPKALRHRIEDWAEACGAEAPLSPALRLDAKAQADAMRFAPEARPLLVLGFDARAPERAWALEHYAAVARRLTAPAGAMGGARIVLIGSGPTRAAAASLEADGLDSVDAATSLDLLAAAALLSRATLFIGEDSPMLHLAAAMGAPCLGLFGPTDERVRGPYGARARALRGRSWAEVAEIAAKDPRAAMNDVTVDSVEEAANQLLHAGGLT